MSTNFNIPSLFLPYVRGYGGSSEIDLDFVVQVLENTLQSRGCIRSIDHRPTKDGMGSMCFVHFNYWPRNRIASQMMIRLNSGERDIKIWHSEKYFWKLALNTAIKKKENSFKPYIAFKTPMPEPTEAEIAANNLMMEKEKKRNETGNLLLPVTFDRLMALNAENGMKKTANELEHLSARIVGMFVDPDSNNDLDELAEMARDYMSNPGKANTEIQNGIKAIEEWQSITIF